MSEFIEIFSNELTLETVSAHDIALLHSLPPGLAQHILDYAETISESEDEKEVKVQQKSSKEVTLMSSDDLTFS